MGHSTAVQVREVGGAVIVTLTYAPWPITVARAPVGDLFPDGVPARPAGLVYTFEWGFAPNGFLDQLWDLPMDRPTEWYLPLAGGAGLTNQYGWVQGVYTGPDQARTWTRTDWDRITARLLAAEPV